jgi:outer membrane protein assembly factor BamD (BamD/ComL family)
MQYRHYSIVHCYLLFFWLAIQGFAQSRSSSKPEIIRDTDVAEGKDSTKPKPKELNPMLAEQNINIGNFYLKKKNYDAAIQRFLLALEYQPTSGPAYEALGRAYEKNGQISKAINTFTEFTKKYPNSPKCPDFRAKIARLAKLDKKSP